MLVAKQAELAGEDVVATDVFNPDLPAIARVAHRFRATDASDSRPEPSRAETASVPRTF